MAREIVLAIDVDQDADDVFEAITTQEGLAGFWTPDVTASPGPGATLRFGFDAAPVDLELTLASADRDEQIVWSVGDAWPHWRNTTITWSLTDAPTGGALRVVLVHNGWPDDYDDGELGSVAYTWSLVLGALDRYLATGVAEPALG